VLQDAKLNMSPSQVKALEAKGAARAKNLTKAFDSYTRVAVRGFKELDGHNGAVYRNIELSASEFTGQFKEGGTYVEKGFASTATDKSGTATFRGNTTLVINSRGGAKSVSHIAQNPKEKEATVLPGSRFRVLKIVERKNDKGEALKFVFLDEILGK
jgi:hypothetical protein